MARKAGGRKMNTEGQRLYGALECFVLAAPFLIGLFFPWTSAAATLWLLGILFYAMRGGEISVSFSPCLIAACSIPIFLLFGGLWGTDRGMALPGMVQFLPLPLFVLLLEQLEPEKRPALMRFLPEAAAVMVFLSAILSRIPKLGYFFLVNGRLGGFFQYPNTFALYLLTGVILLLFGREKAAAHRIVLLLILLGGILLSGSRTVMALLLAVLLFFCFLERDRRLRLIGVGALALVLGAGGLYVLVTGKTGAIGRFWSSSLSSSELLGRFLYARDALPVIVRHPLGLGYMGYYRLQGSFQTGVYTVSHVHNELLQLLLDTGWIPALLLVRAWIPALRCGEGGIWRKVLLAVFGLHCLLDFDTQFTSMAILLFLVLDTAPRGGKTIRARGVILAGVVLCAGLSVWIGTASGFLWNREPLMAARIYPAYTTALIRGLPQTEGAEQAALAERVLRLCDASADAWDVKARSALAEGDVEAMIEAKRKAIFYAKYRLSEYQDYINLLARAVQASGTEEPERLRCREEMAGIPELLETVKAGTSPLGWRIRDLPNLELTGQWKETVARVSGMPVQ